MELVIKLGPWVIAIVAILTLVINVKSRKTDLALKQQEQRYKERNVYFQSNQSWNEPLMQSKPICTVIITNKDERDIKVSDICWSLEGDTTTWEVSVNNHNSEKVNKLLPKKLSSSDSLEFTFDADKVTDILWLNQNVSQFMKADIISRLRMRVSLTTGESTCFMIGPYLQLYILKRNVTSTLMKFIGEAMIRRAHNKALQQISR